MAPRHIEPPAAGRHGLKGDVADKFSVNGRRQAGCGPFFNSRNVAAMSSWFLTALGHGEPSKRYPAEPFSAGVPTPTAQRETMHSVFLLYLGFLRPSSLLSEPLSAVLQNRSVAAKGSQPRRFWRSENFSAPFNSASMPIAGSISILPATGRPWIDQAKLDDATHDQNEEKRAENQIWSDRQNSLR